MLGRPLLYGLLLPPEDFFSGTPNGRFSRSKSRYVTEKLTGISTEIVIFPFKLPLGNGKINGNWSAQAEVRLGMC